MTASGLAGLLTPKLIDDFWGYCGDQETIDFAGTNLLAELSFLEEFRVDRRLALSTVEVFIFLTDSPLLEIESKVQSFGADAIRSLAVLLQLEFIERIRNEAGWVAVPRPRLRQILTALIVAKASGEAPDSLEIEADRSVLTDAQAARVARYVNESYPEVARYIFLTKRRAIDHGYKDGRLVGGLREPATLLERCRRSLIGVAGSKDWRSTIKIVNQIVALLEDSE